MLGYLLVPLLDMLNPYFNLSKARLKIMAIILFGRTIGRTVNFSPLTNHLTGSTLHASSHRLLQRLLEYIQLDGDMVTQSIVRVLNLR